MKKLPLNSFSGHSGHGRPGTENFATDFALTGKREEGKTGKWRKREEGFMTFRFVPHPSIPQKFFMDLSSFIVPIRGGTSNKFYENIRRQISK